MSEACQTLPSSELSSMYHPALLGLYSWINTLSVDPASPIGAPDDRY